MPQQILNFQLPVTKRKQSGPHLGATVFVIFCYFSVKLEKILTALNCFFSHSMIIVNDEMEYKEISFTKLDLKKNLRDGDCTA